MDAPAPPRLFLSPPHLSGGELAAVAAAFESNYVAPQGPAVDAFEAAFRAYTGIGHALALSSGTAALHLALRELGVGPGDRVICASLTFIGNVAPVTYQGAVPVLLDVDPASWTLDVGLLEAELRRADAAGELPKVVLPTDLYGQCADLDAIQAVCGPYDIPVVVDAAESLGARYRGRPAGQGARAAAYSFNGNKIITTSGGGLLAADDPELIARARFLSQQARDPAPHYQHTTIGYNYRMSNILAAIGGAQLEVLDQRVARRRAIFESYRKLLGDLPGLSFMPEVEYNCHNRWLTVIQIDPQRFGAGREQVRKDLEDLNIESRPVWKPMHLQPVFAAAPRVGGSVSERLFADGLCLPSGSQMSDDDVARVAAAVAGCCAQRPVSATRVGGNLGKGSAG